MQQGSEQGSEQGSVMEGPREYRWIGEALEPAPWGAVKVGQELLDENLSRHRGWTLPEELAGECAYSVLGSRRRCRDLEDEGKVESREVDLPDRAYEAQSQSAARALHNAHANFILLQQAIGAAQTLRHQHEHGGYILAAHVADVHDGGLGLDEEGGWSCDACRIAHNTGDMNGELGSELGELIQEAASHFVSAYYGLS